jgi:hypothetical protein
MKYVLDASVAACWVLRNPLQAKALTARLGVAAALAVEVGGPLGRVGQVRRGQELPKKG